LDEGDGGGTAQPAAARVHPAETLLDQLLADKSTIDAWTAPSHSSDLFQQQVAAAKEESIRAQAAEEQAAEEAAFWASAAASSQPPQVNVCVICLHNPVDIALVPCFHVQFCRDCAQHIHKAGGSCPACRGDIHRLQRVYL
jgi:hypothetical protein